MKLLFDANISYRIVKKVIDVFPASEHVNKAELENKKDITIWNYAKHNGFSIVTFDEDFNELSILKGYPPKIVWLRCGNVSTDELSEKLRINYNAIKSFLGEDISDTGCLEIY